MRNVATQYLVSTIANYLPGVPTLVLSYAISAAKARLTPRAIRDTRARLLVSFFRMLRRAQSNRRMNRLTMVPALWLGYNITENGMEAEKNRAAIWEVDRAPGRWRIFASGLRNPNGLTWEPRSHVLWAVVNERDEIGPNRVPDYLTSVKDGAFYGWPYSCYGQNVDPRVQPQRPDLVAKAITPDYALELACRAAWPGV